MLGWCCWFLGVSRRTHKPSWGDGGGAVGQTAGRDGDVSIEEGEVLTEPIPHPAGSEQSLSVRSPVSTWAYLQHLRAIDSQKELLRLSRDLES